MQSETFENVVQEILAHLYDPEYSLPHRFWSALGVDRDPTREYLHALLFSAIEDMKPSEDVPDTSRLWRYYELLSCRYIHELTQKETAQRLNITPRHLRREQNQAVRALAQRLWIGQRSARNGPAAESESTDLWAEQVRDELAVLQNRDPNTVANVAIELRRVVNLFEAISRQRGISLSIAECENGLLAGIHPSILRQVLIAAVEDLVDHSTQGSITLRACTSDDCVEIELAGGNRNRTDGKDSASILRMLAADGDISQFSENHSEGGIRLRIPLLRPILVLVIDDNTDVVHVYRRYVTSTHYQIIHLGEPIDPISEIIEARPDMVVLDVMMPNLDGWEVLAELGQHPATHNIPVIVCSVIRQQEFAQALGASAYLSKPVKREQFLEALDRVWTSTSTIGKPREIRSAG